MTAKEILKEMMAQRGFSQGMLADVSGYSIGGIGSYIHHQDNYRMGTYHRLVTAMGGQIIFRYVDDFVIDMEEETEKTAIQKIRKMRGWTYLRLAEACGYERQTNVTRLLYGKTSMRTDMVVRLMQGLRAKVIVRDEDGAEYEMEG